MAQGYTEDWSGRGTGIVDEDDIDPVGPPPNTFADAIVKGGASTQTAKFDDDGGIGSPFAGRFWCPAGNWSIYTRFTLDAPMVRPTVALSFRADTIGAIVASGLLSEGTAILVRSSAAEAFRIQFAEGAIQIYLGSWWFIKSDGSLSTNPADADKTRWVVDTNYDLEIEWLTDTTFNIKLGGVVQNASPITVNTPGSYDEIWTGNLRLNGNVWYGTTYLGSTAPPSGGEILILCEPPP